MQIRINVLGGLSQAQEAVFLEEASRWEEVLPGDLSPVMIGGEVTRGIIIDAEGVDIDGEGRVLGSAGPTELRREFRGLPARGVMRFDVADIAALEREGTFRSVILHEIAHVLGLGTLWERFQLLTGATSDDPRFVGLNAVNAYYELLRQAGRGDDSFRGVPVANTGGPGTRNGHWREDVFEDELMTGFLSGTTQPLSRLTVASFEDLGYGVDYAAAEAYRLGEEDLRVLRTYPLCRHCRVQRPEISLVPEEAMIREV